MEERFRTDTACRVYIRRLRWPDRFVCPRCGVFAFPWEMAGEWLSCRACRSETSLTSGTIFEGARKPLRQWLLRCGSLSARRMVGVHWTFSEFMVSVATRQPGLDSKSCAGPWSGLAGSAWWVNCRGGRDLRGRSERGRETEIQSDHRGNCRRRS